MRWFSANKHDAGKRSRTTGAFARQTGLAAAQAEIHRDFEAAIDTADAQLRAIATRLSQLGPEATREDVRALEAEQDRVRRLVRRIQAALAGREELEREHEAWASRADESSALHADHPRVRAEIARSELAVRSGEVSDKLKVESEKYEHLPLSTSHSSLAVLVHAVDPRLIPDEAHLIRAIREAVREAERWHGIPPDEVDMDAVDQVRHVRELHAILKRLDRERHIRRDRLMLSIDPREFH